ncbi:MAG: type II secretion system protein J [Planctomycetota bacterium]
MGAPRRHGFTLIELILVIGIFAMVLTMAYQTLISTLEADQRITRNTRSGKIGEAILTIIRRDLQGAIYRGLGTEVFRVVDGGSGESADDTIDFLTTAPIPDPTDGDEAWVGEVASVGYVLKRGSDDSNTLFRRVKWNIADGPLEGGQHFPIYNRVMGLELCIAPLSSLTS